MCCSVCSSDSELVGHHVVVSVDLFPAHVNVWCRFWIVSDRIFVTNLNFSSAVANVLLSYASSDARWFVSCAQAECCLCAHREAHQRERRRGCLISASGVSCAHRASLISASGRVAKHLPTLVLPAEHRSKHSLLVRCGLLISTLAFTSGRMTDRCVRRRSSFATLAAAGRLECRRARRRSRRQRPIHRAAAFLFTVLFLRVRTTNILTNRD